MGNVFKLGFEPTRRFVFSKEDAFKFKKLTGEKIKNYGIEVVDLEGINEEVDADFLPQVRC